MLDLSIIVLTRDHMKVLDECLTSVYTHTRKISFEVMVTDNGSSDGTQAMLRKRYENVTLIENGRNIGFTEANNKGLKIAKGRYALLLNDDTYITDDVFSQIVGYMDKNESVGICGPKLLNPDGSLQRQGSVLSYFRWSAKRPINVPMVIGAAMAIRMSMIAKIGLLDENLFFYNDDLDICLRARKAGYQVTYYPLSSVYHYGGFSSRGGPNVTLLLEGYRGGLYFSKKYYGKIVYSVYRMLLLVYVLIALSYTWITSRWNSRWFELYSKVLRVILSQQILSKQRGL